MPGLGADQHAGPHAPPVRSSQRLEGLAGDALVGLDVARAGPGDDLVGDRRARAASCPSRSREAQSRTYCLSKLGCAAPDLVALGGPVARGVGRQHLVAEHQLAVARPARTRTSCRRGSRRARARARRRTSTARSTTSRTRSISARSPTSSAARSKSIASSWPSSAFVLGVKIGSGSCSDSRRPAGSAIPRDRAGGLVVLPARAGDVAAHDALDRAASAAGATTSARPRTSSGTPSVTESRWLATMCRGPLEPEHRQPGEHLALVGDRRRVHRRRRSRCGRWRPSAGGRRGRTSRGPSRWR